MRMRVLIRVIAFLVVGCVLFFLGRGMWPFVSTHTAPVFLSAYAFLAVAQLGGAAWFTRQVWSSRNPLGGELLLYRMATAAQDSPLRRFRRNITIVLTLVINAFTWPSIFLVALLRSRRLRKLRLESNARVFRADEVLHTPLLIQMYAMVCTVAVAVVLQELGSITGVIAWVIYYGAVILASLWLLTFIVNPDPLPARLRQTSGNPYLQFFLVSLAVVLMLLLASLGIRHGGQALRTDRVVEVASNLAQFREIKKVIAGRNAGAMDVMISVTVFLFSITLFGTLKRWSEFKRTDPDLVGIADALLQLRQPRQALAFIEKGSQETIPALNARLTAYLEVNDFERVHNTLEKLTAFDQPGGSQGYRSKIPLLNLLLNYPVPAVPRHRVLSEWLNSPTPDWQAAIILPEFANRSLLTHEELFDLLGKHDAEKRYPLTVIRSLLLKEGLSEARERLTQIQPTTPMDDAVYRFAKLEVGLMDPETSIEQDRRFFNEWLTDNLNVIKSLGVEVKPDSEKVPCIHMLNAIAMLCRHVDREREEECLYATREVEGSVTSPEIRSMMGVAVPYFYGE
jgi:hypothetical protein